MKFVLVIHLDNAAMTEIGGLNDALGKVMHAVAGLDICVGQGGAVRDISGNTVGKWEVVE